MKTEADTLGKLRILEELYRSGRLSDVIERTVDKLIELERDRAERELDDLTGHLRAFESQYQMSSEEFYQRYERGELGDSVDFMEWSSFYDMACAARKHLDRLLGELS